MKNFINLIDIPAESLRKIILDAKKRKKKRKNLSSLDIDKDTPTDYEPTDYSISDKEYNLDQVLEDIKDTDTFNRTINVLTKDWDAESKETISVALNIPLDQLKVDIIDSKTFWIAEKYHQDFAVKNPLKYNFYRNSCGRDNRLKKVWGDKNLLFKDL